MSKEFPFKIVTEMDVVTFYLEIWPIMEKSVVNKLIEDLLYAGYYIKKE